VIQTVTKHWRFLLFLLLLDLLLLAGLALPGRARRGLENYKMNPATKLEHSPRAFSVMISSADCRDKRLW
jgi:hypothetical protein